LRFEGEADFLRHVHADYAGAHRVPVWLAFGEIEREVQRGENLSDARAGGSFKRVALRGTG
jgi:hypothetical protein